MEPQDPTLHPMMTATELAFLLQALRRQTSQLARKQQGKALEKRDKRATFVQYANGVQLMHKLVKSYRKIRQKSEGAPVCDPFLFVPGAEKNAPEPKEFLAGPMAVDD